LIGEVTLDPGASPFVPCTEEDQLLDDPSPEDIPISTQETTPAVVAAPTTPDPRPDPPDVPLPTDCANPVGSTGRVTMRSGRVTCPPGRLICDSNAKSSLCMTG